MWQRPNGDVPVNSCLLILEFAYLATIEFTKKWFMTRNSLAPKSLFLTFGQDTVLESISIVTCMSILINIITLVFARSKFINI